MSGALAEFELLTDDSELLYAVPETEDVACKVVIVSVPLLGAGDAFTLDELV